MSATSSGFSLREFLQLLFPALLGLCLFVPLYPPLNGKASIEGLLFAALVLGMTVSSPVNWLSKKCTPWILGSKKSGEAMALREWTVKSLDLERLQTQLSKDEREYLDVIGSLAICYRQTAFILLVYSLWSAYTWGRELLEPLERLLTEGVGQSTWSTVPTIWRALIGPTTPMLGDWRAPTLFVLAATTILIPFLLHDSLKQQNVLFMFGGEYEHFGIKYQATDPDIARAIWGKVSIGDKAAANTPVTLIVAPAVGGEVTQLASTNAYGLFTIPVNIVEHETYDVEVSGQRQLARLASKKVRCLEILRAQPLPSNASPALPGGLNLRCASRLD